MATDYDAPRKTDEEASEESIEELKARRHDKNSGKVDEDEAEAAESFELPGADLSHEELAVEVQAPAGRRVHLHELLPRAPPQPARRREEDDLPRLRLTHDGRSTKKGRPRRAAPSVRPAPAQVARGLDPCLAPLLRASRRAMNSPDDADRGAAEDREDDRLPQLDVRVGGVGRGVLAPRADLPGRVDRFLGQGRRAERRRPGPSRSLSCRTVRSSLSAAGATALSLPDGRGWKPDRRRPARRRGCGGAGSRPASTAWGRPGPRRAPGPTW